jgi:hypothetical protein
VVGGVAGLNAENNPRNVSLEDYLGLDGGPPRFFSPIDQVDTEDKPLLIFYPGIDGTGMNVIKQFAPLAEKYQLRCLNVPNRDRTPFR